VNNQTGNKYENQEFIFYGYVIHIVDFRHTCSNRRSIPTTLSVGRENISQPEFYGQSMACAFD